MAGEDEGQFDQAADLRAERQQARIEEERAEDEARQAAVAGGPSSSASPGSLFGIPRDQWNDDVVRATVKPEPVLLLLLGLPFLSLQMFKGKMMSGGKDKTFDEPSFRPWGMQYLPKEGMQGLIVAGWIILGVLGIVSLIFDIFLLYLIGLAITDPLTAAVTAKNMLGAFGCTLVQWLGFPTILC